VKTTLGYVCLVLSTILYVVIFALPFVDLSTDTKIITGTVLYATSYALMFLGGALLGREVIDKMKELFKKYWRRKPVTKAPSEVAPAQENVEE